MNGPKASTGSRLLSEEMARRGLSYQDVSQELETKGYNIERYSIWQWAHGVSRPSLRNAFAVEEWSQGKISAKSWNEGGAAKAVAAEKPKKKSAPKTKKVKAS